MDKMDSLEQKVANLVDMWPKDRKNTAKEIEIKLLLQNIKDESQFQELLNAVEIKIEDTPVKKLPALAMFAMGVLNKNNKSVTPAPVITNKPVKVNKAEDANKKIEKSFNYIWDIWPKNPDYVEKRQRALEAFSSQVRALPLEEVQSACVAYAESFNEGPSIYAKTMKNFLSDRELLGHWMEVSKNKANNKVDRDHFEAAYSRYPDFNNKTADKTIDSGWVVYWRKIQLSERLEFMAACMAYGDARRQLFRNDNFDYSKEEIVYYTKSFASFCSEWTKYEDNGLFDKFQLAQAKLDLTGNFIVQCLKENGVDVLNLWGKTDSGPFFSHMGLKC